MKKKVFLSLMVIVSLFVITGCKKHEEYIANSDYLYNIAVQHIIDNDDNKERYNDGYKLFIDYSTFGITKDKSYRYVYMWIAEESYYILDNKIISGSGSSMPYKFTFELNDNKVIKIETPKDGNEYTSSIKEMYPDDIENKAINFQWKDDTLIKEVRNYYSDLKDKSIYYYSGDKNNNGEYIKLDK